MKEGKTDDKRERKVVWKERIVRMERTERRG